MMTEQRSELDEMLDGARRIADSLDRLVAVAQGNELDAADVASLFADHGYGLELADDADGYDIDDAQETAQRILDEYGLDFYETGERRFGGEWEPNGWVFVVTTGGPHYELRSDGRVYGWGWFGANKVQSAVSDETVAYFDAMTEGY